MKSAALLLARVVCCLAFTISPRARGQEAVGDRVTVAADRLPDADSGAPFSVAVVTPDDLRHAPQLRLDDILREQVPGFSLFRRSSSRIANPTTQGVTLRNFGPSGAGRTLVLLDGIPLNDPFAGYVLWNQVPPASLDSVLAISGGGAGLFGSAALAGTIFLQTRHDDSNAATLETTIGNTHTYGGSLSATLVQKPVTLSAFAEVFSTAGYSVLQANQRGPVDTNATSESVVVQGAADFALTSDASLKLQVREFREDRGNGTRYTSNDTRGTDASAELALRVPQVHAELKLTAYGQVRKFRSTFSSINAARDVETPALDQYDVPADAVGGSAVWTMSLGAQHRLTLGADARWIEGETNEAFRHVGNQFTRLRNAGGEQIFVGTFAQDTWNASPSTTIVAAARVDRWDLFDGSRTESDRQTGAVTLHSDYPDRGNYEANGRLGARVQITRGLTVRAAAYTGFRVPTLNELYRPFRVGNAVTEANPNLNPEHLLGGEIGWEARPVSTLRLNATVFYNRLEDAIGNITIGYGPGTFDPGGFIPAGGVLRQRQNVDLVTAPGAELGAQWQIVPQLSLEAHYLYTDPTIARAAARDLVGKLLAQTPQHVVTSAVNWTPTSKWFLTVQARYSGRQFEDDQNTTALAPFVTVDAAVAYDFTERLSASVKVENIFDTEIETGKSLDGLVSIGAPRLTTLQLRLRL
ncbi:MAG: TonB-dependent receptor [Chthoniobacterales bacterium]